MKGDIGELQVRSSTDKTFDEMEFVDGISIPNSCILALRGMRGWGKKKTDFHCGQ